MPDFPIHPDGVFVDTKTNEVVAGKPEEGVQLVAPGGEITPDAKNEIELAGGDPAEFIPAETTAEPEPEVVDKPEPPVEVPAAPEGA